MNNSFNDLKDKVCIITGGAGVIGSSMVEALAQAGVKTAILDRREEVAVELAAEISDKYQVETAGFRADVLDKNLLAEAKSGVLEKFGKIDILINGAGGNSPDATTKLEKLDSESIGQLEDSFFGLKIEGFQKVFDLNFIGTLLPTMVFAEDMVKQGTGSVVNISSMNFLH